MITEYGGKEKYASKKEQMKHEDKETPKMEKSEKGSAEDKSGPKPMPDSKAPQSPVKKKIVLGKANVDLKDMHRTDNNPVGTVKSVPTEKEIKKVQADSKRKIILAKKTEGPKNADGRTEAQEKEYIESLNEQIQMGKESDERFKKTPAGLMIEGKKAENKGNMKEARRLYEAARKAGLTK